LLLLLVLGAIVLHVRVREAVGVVAILTGVALLTWAAPDRVAPAAA
jgi:hypothetical protein